jgi:adenosylcobinamide-phosphate synthase
VAERLAGIVTALTVYSACGFAAFGIIRLAGLIHPLAADIVSILLIYTTIAARDLARHSMAVFRPLIRGDLPAARGQVAMIVGRDVDRLDEAGVTRAAVESVAESTVDGVTAPLFFAMLFGPVGAVVYRAINTLDSLFGYTDERYLRFGWASARIDDVANWIPARLTAPLVALAAAVLRLRPAAARAALRIMWRDAGNHASPNAGWPEAAMAGALGVQVGGTNYYAGEPVDKPTIGDPVVPLAPRHIRQVNALMFATAGLFLLVGLTVRWALGRVI